MTRSSKNEIAKTSSTALWRVALTVLLMSIVCWMTSCARTRTQLLVLPADRTILFLHKGETFVASNDVYLVPPARMQDIYRARRITNTTNLNTK